MRRLHEQLRCDPHKPLQLKEFFGSITTLRPDVLGHEELQRIAQSLELDTAGFMQQGESLVILRHTLMNPYLIDAENGISYIDGYFDFLAKCVRELHAQGPRSA